MNEKLHVRYIEKNRDTVKPNKCSSSFYSIPKYELNENYVKILHETEAIVLHLEGIDLLLLC